MSPLREAIKQAAREGLEIYSVVGIVKERNDEARTVDVEPSNGDAMLLDVRLQAAPGEKGMCLYPRKGSTVVVTFLNKSTGYVALCSDVEEVALKIDKLLISADETLFNDGLNGGLINIKTLVDRLNRLETRMVSHQHLLGTTPTVLDPGTNKPITPTTAADLEDTKVKH